MHAGHPFYIYSILSHTIQWIYNIISAALFGFIVYSKLYIKYSIVCPAREKEKHCRAGVLLLKRNTWDFPKWCFIWNRNFVVAQIVFFSFELNVFACLLRELEMRALLKTLFIFKSWTYIHLTVSRLAATKGNDMRLFNVVLLHLPFVRDNARRDVRQSVDKQMEHLRLQRLL